tara:strand:+ start:526 stop:801 length:276 start_codon:yes stop_codon:yes gene_type:complete
MLKLQTQKSFRLQRLLLLVKVTPATWGTKNETWGIKMAYNDMDYSLPKYSSTKDPGLPPGSKSSSQKMSTGDGGKDKHNAPTSGGDGKYPE